MNEKKRLRKGEARIQIIACQERIEKLSVAGYGPVAIHEILFQEGVITMTYGGFYEAVRYSEIRKKRRKKNLARSTVGTSITEIKPPPQPTVMAPAIQIKDLTPEPTNAEWSLDEKLAVINAGSTSKKAKKRDFDVETEEYNETEVL